MSDIEGKAAREAARKYGKRPSFKRRPAALSEFLSSFGIFAFRVTLIINQLP